jgi:hypothetical protein
MSLDQVQFLLEIVPSLTKDGRTLLRFTPKAEFGETLPDLQPAVDGSGMVFQLTKPSKAFPALNWEVTLAANEFLIIGANIDQPLSLGYQAFIQDNGSRSVQRLLVLRTSRSKPGGDEDGTLEDMARTKQSPPLAFQATLSAVRANGH